MSGAALYAGCEAVSGGLGPGLRSDGDLLLFTMTL